MTKPILYREHKGSLDESMKTVREVRDFEHLLEIIRENRSRWPDLDGTVTTDSVVLRRYGFDERIGWETCLVLVGGKPEGFINNDLGRVGGQ